MNLLSKDSWPLRLKKSTNRYMSTLKLGKTWIGFSMMSLRSVTPAVKMSLISLCCREKDNSKTDCNVYAWSPGCRTKWARDQDWIKKLPYLWYDAINEHKTFRCDYMDAVASLVRDNYNGQVCILPGKGPAISAMCWKTRTVHV